MLSVQVGQTSWRETLNTEVVTAGMPNAVNDTIISNYRINISPAPHQGIVNKTVRGGTEH